MIGVVLVLAAGGCSAGATQEPSPTTSRSVVTEQPTATASETVPAPPEMPAEAKEMTAEGAAAFAKHYFEVADYAYATGDVEPLRRLVADDCSACLALIAEIEDVYRDGGRFQGVDAVITSAVAPPPDEQGTIVSIVMSESASAVVQADGSIESETAATQDVGISVFTLRTPQGWRIFEISKAA